LPITASTVITWTYEDGNGNTSTQTQNVVISDAIAPLADEATLADVTAECEITSLTAPTATDNCAGSITGTHNATLPINIQGTTVVTWTYDDGNGNTSTQTQNVVIDDVTAPLADNSTLADVTAECEVTSLTAPTATDNCAGSITGTHNATLPITASTVITWTYEDGNGNTSTQTQNVVIDDVTAPLADEVTLADVTAECEVTSLTAPTATDNCAGSITGTHNATLPINIQGTTTVVTWTYDDGNGNTSTQTQNVVIDDITNPTITCVGNQTVAAENTHTYSVSGTEFDPTASDDNCGVASVINDFNNSASLSGAQLPEGTITIVWTVTDNAGNSQTCSVDVVVTTYVGLSDLSAKGISVYPNPVKNTLHIEMSNKQNATVRLTDVSGRVLLTVPATQNKMAIDMSSHENGLYFLHIETSSASETIKIIKQ
jgi:carbon monoxide dehydrogenase subunit G